MCIKAGSSNIEAFKLFILQNKRLSVSRIRLLSVVIPYNNIVAFQAVDVAPLGNARFDLHC